MNDSLVAEPIDKGFTFAAFEMQPPQGQQQKDWPKGNPYSPEKSDEFVDLVERAPAEHRDPKQTFRNSMEIQTLPQTTFGGGVSPIRE